MICQNNYIRKSQSNYESYTILSDDPPPITMMKRNLSSGGDPPPMAMMKRNLSTEEIRNGNISSPTSPKLLAQKQFNGVQGASVIDRWGIKVEFHKKASKIRRPNLDRIN